MTKEMISMSGIARMSSGSYSTPNFGGSIASRYDPDPKFRTFGPHLHSDKDYIWVNYKDDDKLDRQTLSSARDIGYVPALASEHPNLKDFEFYSCYEIKSDCILCEDYALMWRPNIKEYDGENLPLESSTEEPILALPPGMKRLEAKADD